MVSVLREICDWATTLAYWEQAALDKIVTGVRFGDSDYDELLQYLLEDAELAQPLGQRPALHFPQSTFMDPEAGSPVHLMKLTDLKHINALVPGQTLAFGPQMTAIYGGNGSGKSGYARVLGCAGFTRGDQEVLPDVTRPTDESVVLSAEIHVGDNTGERTIHYEVGKSCPELASCYVFDSTSVRVHLTESNELSFSPAGLSYLTELAEVTDNVRARLKDKIDERSQDHDFGRWFGGASEVTELIAALGLETDIEVVRRVAGISAEDVQRIDDLQLQTAHLRTEDIPGKIKALGQKKQDLDNLVAQVQQARDGLSDEACSGIAKAVSTWQQRQKAARQASAERFRSEHFTQAGTQVWRDFIAAAKALAETERSPDVPYPQPDDHCLLCHQPLSAEARDLIVRLWAFLEGEAQARLEKAESTLAGEWGRVRDIELDFFEQDSVAYRYLRDEAAELLSRVEAVVCAHKERRQGIQQMIEKRQTIAEIRPVPDDCIPELQELIGSLVTRLEELRQRDPTDEIAKLEQQRLNLSHRRILSEHLEEVEAYLRDRQWAHHARRIGGSTRHI